MCKKDFLFSEKRKTFSNFENFETSFFRFNNLTLRKLVLNHEDDYILRICRVLIFTDFEEIGEHSVTGATLFALISYSLNATGDV